ncbi:amidohydrolase family protein [Roseomonas sp. NAR14]|uniref:Amidohydrolase family protein n=1 Tax=Roseomonas acroporae TaxID=2937791 RepID=A0A9X2BX14_9PROT|nr:amidohydrolase family protein [Roseomonas acroporae]MCK8784500.1 amidohydrolase family protein [Roseomonas acroporae]
MRLDAYTHLFPPGGYMQRLMDLVPDKGPVKRWLNLPTLWDVEARMRMVDSFGDYQQVLANTMPPVEVVVGPDAAPDLVRQGNDGFAELIRQRPDHFPAFIASLPMNNPEAAVAEVDRAVAIGACGFQIFTNVAGRPLDLPEFQPIFDRIVHHDVPIWLHPARGANFPDYRSESKSKYEIWWTIGWPYETSAAMSRLVFSGLFDRLPEIKIITHHLGAMIPYFEGRFGPGNDQLGTRTEDEDYVALLHSLKKRPIDYFHMFYGDTALFGSAAGTRCGLSFFGADRVVFASDCPFDPEGGYQFIRDTIRVLDELEISETDRRKLFEGNLRRLIRR